MRVPRLGVLDESHFALLGQKTIAESLMLPSAKTLAGLTESQQALLNGLRPSFEEAFLRSAQMASVAEHLASSEVARAVAESAALPSRFEMAEIERMMTSVNAPWREAQQIAHRLADVGLRQRGFLEGSLSGMIEASRAIGAHLSDIHREMAAACAFFETRPWDELTIVTGGLVAASSRLCRSLETSPDSALTLPPAASTMPALELFNHARVVELLTRRHPIVEEDELPKETNEDAGAEPGYPLEAMLARLNPELVRLLEGARQAFSSRNPDRVRHLVVSLRELYRAVTHMLAPDDRVEARSVGRQDLDSNGRPSRRARLHYIMRGIDHGPFKEFVRTDVETTLKLVDLYQEGTHAVSCTLTEDQIRALVVRTEAMLIFLLSIAKN